MCTQETIGQAQTNKTYSYTYSWRHSLMFSRQIRSNLLLSWRLSFYGAVLVKKGTQTLYEALLFYWIKHLSQRSNLCLAYQLKLNLPYRIKQGDEISPFNSLDFPFRNNKTLEYFRVFLDMNPRNQKNSDKWSCDLSLRLSSTNVRVI